MVVLLADDHALVRAGIHALVAELPNVTEVVEASDGPEALVAVAEHKPDVVLMDIAMPGMDGLEATARIVKQSPGTRVIILSVHQSEELVRGAFHVGAFGYLLKAAAASELQEALRAVARGKMYVSASVRKMFDDWRGSEPAGTNILVPELTPRQREVLRLIAEGLGSRQIAQSLGIHVKTVDTHRTELMKRLGIHNVAGLVRYAVRHGVVSDD
jgi:DNA-binding NarL/FixJ family response regulator